MKTTFLRNTLMVSVLAIGFSFTSCKKKTETETDTTTEIETTEGSEAPMDTIVREDDTIIQTGTGNDTKENPTGTQVP